MDKYNLKELDEKLKYCKNMKVEDVTLDDVDEISSIKIDILIQLKLQKIA